MVNESEKKRMSSRSRLPEDFTFGSQFQRGTRTSRAPPSEKGGTFVSPLRPRDDADASVPHLADAPGPRTDDTGRANQSRVGSSGSRGEDSDPNGPAIATRGVGSAADDLQHRDGPGGELQQLRHELRRVKKHHLADRVRSALDQPPVIWILAARS